MRRFALAILIFLSTSLWLSCSSDEPDYVSETLTFVVTASGYVPQEPPEYKDPNIPPPVGQAVCYDIDPRCPNPAIPQCPPPGTDLVYPPRPISVEFKPEIRIFAKDSSSYQVIELEEGMPDDPEYFGRTPYDTVCSDAVQKWYEADPNYQFTCSTDASKVVALFKKKDYYGTPQAWKDDATMKVDVYINDVLWKSFMELDPSEGGLTVIVPIN
ncbi:MAG: hypothetical protein AB1756_09660 [Acidobacteriota bacterium]